MKLFRLPGIRPDETLYSLAARIRMVNVAGCDREACRCIFGATMNTHVDEFPVDMDHFCRVTSEQFGTPEKVAIRFTLVAYFEKLGSFPWHGGSRKLKATQARYGLGSLSNGPGGRWRTCPKCLARDQSQWGAAYWHLSHQSPTTLVCPIDGVPLDERVLPTPARHNQFFPPDEIPSKTTQRLAREIRKHQYVLDRLARLNASILADELPTIPRVAARLAFFHALSEHDLVKASGRIRRDEFVHALQARYGMLSAFSGFVHELSNENLGRLASELTGGVIHSTLHELLLIDYLFGSWATYQNHCQWQTVMECNPTEISDAIRRVNPIENIASDLAQWRQVCQEALETSPTLSRTSFARIAPKAFRWLSRNDARWLDEAIPKRQCQSYQGQLFLAT